MSCLSKSRHGRNIVLKVGRAIGGVIQTCNTCVDNARTTDDPKIVSSSNVFLTDCSTIQITNGHVPSPHASLGAGRPAGERPGGSACGTRVCPEAGHWGGPVPGRHPTDRRRAARRLRVLVSSARAHHISGRQGGAPGARGYPLLQRQGHLTGKEHVSEVGVRYALCSPGV